MNTSTIFRTVGFLALFFAQACSGSASNGPPDPAAPENLHKAAPLKWGTTCMEHDQSSYGTASEDKTFPVCREGFDCSNLQAKNSEAYAGDLYISSTSYGPPTFFEGTCDNQQPVTCDQRPRANDCDACQYDNCCVHVALCEDDPNCVAIVDCVNACKDDQKCADRCMTNGIGSASYNFGEAAKCIVANCKDRCP